MKPDHQRCLIAFRLAVLASPVSCRQIVDFAEPPPPSNDRPLARRAAGDAGARTTDAGNLFDPKPPFLSGPECLRCKEEYCHAETAACDGDEFCSRWRNEARELGQPLLTAIPLLHELSDAQWASDRGEADATKVLNASGACVTSSCAAACEIGRDFSCVGRFDWPAGNRGRTEIRFGVSDGISSPSRFDGWRVSACARQSVCQRPMGEATTQDGFATLSIDFSLAPPGVGVLPYFDGFLQVDVGPDFLPAQLDTSIPFYDQDYYGIYMTNAALVRGTSEAKGLPYDEHRGLLQVWPWDCNYVFMATGVTVEVWNSTEAGFRLCGADCAFAYPDSSGQPDVNLKDFSSGSFAPATASVAPGDIMVVMRDTKTRLPLSVLRPVTIRAGYVHTIHMRPASSEQLSGLPESAL